MEVCLCIVYFSADFIVKKLDLVALEDASLYIVGVIFVDANIAIKIIQAFFDSIEDIGIEPCAAVCLESKLKFEFIAGRVFALKYLFGTVKITHPFAKSLDTKTIWEASLSYSCKVFFDMFFYFPIYFFVCSESDGKVIATVFPYGKWGCVSMCFKNFDFGSKYIQCFW